MENLVHHRKFMSAARSVSRVKPIIVVKSGRSEAAARAAASHTGALAARTRLIMPRSGGQASFGWTPSPALQLRRGFEQNEPAPGRKLGHHYQRRGPGVMAVDAFSKWGLEPAALSPETVAGSIRCCRRLGAGATRWISWGMPHRSGI